MVTNRPLVSVLTPTFNQERYIRECLESVQAQTYDNWEQIIIDDGSTDATRKIIERQSHPQCRCIWATHRGILSLSDIYNEGLESARGDYVAILEGDDSWPPNKLARQLTVFDDSGAVLAWGNGVLMNQYGIQIGTVRPIRDLGPSSSLGNRELLPKLLLKNLVVPSSGVVIRKEALDRIGGFHQIKGVPYVDLPTWLALLLEMGKADHFVYTDEHVVNYRIHPDQASRRHQDLVFAAARVAEFCLDSLSQDRLRTLGLDHKELCRIVALQKAREAISRAEWKKASSLLRESWVGALSPMRLSILKSGICSLLRVDLAHISFALQRRLHATAKFNSILGDLWTR